MVLLPALESIEDKRMQAMEVIQRTFTCKITEASTALKLLGKTARTQIMLSPETRERYINTYLEDNTANGAKY